MPTQPSPVGAPIIVSSSPFVNLTANQVAMDANGNFVVIWQNYDGVESYNLLTQRYNAAGVAQGSSTNLGGISSSDSTDAAMDDDGNFVVSVKNYFSVNTQRFNSAGQSQGTDLVDICSNFYAPPSVAIDDNGDYVVAWNDYASGINVRRFTNAGVAKGAETLVEAGCCGAVESADVAIDADGDFVVTWKKGGDIYAQRYDKQGSAAGSIFSVSGTTPTDESAAQVATDAAGNFVVVWANDSEGGEVFARRYNNQGMALDASPFKVGSGLNAYDPQVAVDHDGDFAVTWTDYGLTLGGSNIQARAFDKTGQADGDVFTVDSANSSGCQSVSQPTIAIDADNDFVIAWEHDAPGQNQLLAQRYSIPAPTPIPAPAPTPTPTPSPAPTPIRPVPTPKDDTLSGTDQADTVLALAGRDNISGTAGNDFLFGQSGNDTLDGGDGNDVLNGGAGSDTLTGGKGKDVFYRYRLNRAPDRITDFEIGTDVIALSTQHFQRFFKPDSIQAKHFCVGRKALDRNDRIIYNPEVGSISFDVNGDLPRGVTPLLSVTPQFNLTYQSFVMQNQPTTLV
jgi:Ca2+-binding RTX toxin-like protein